MTKLVERRRINHRGPVSIDVSSAWYFITICAEGHQEWVCAGRDGVPPPSENTAAGGGTPALPHVIRHWKHYLAEHHGLRFQRDFWDTRLRDDAHFAESFRYICNNPVRKGLCAKAIDWPHVIAFDRATGEERAHRGAVAEKGGVR